MIDWSLLLAIISLVLSGTTLYIAHLRGPSIVLAIPPDTLFPCKQHEIRSPSRKNESYIETRLLFLNIGNRPGILFDMVFSSVSKEYFEFQFAKQKPPDLPVVLLPGEEWSGYFRIYTSPESFINKKTFDINVKYTSSETFFRHKKKQDVISIDLKPLIPDLSSIYKEPG